MSGSLVSVIMPAYNAEEYISESIESVIRQSYTNWELIVVDDGSKDATAGIVKGFAEKDDRIRYIYQENGRQGKARNNGLRHAKGEYIAFLDADDLWVDNKLQIQVELMREGKADLIFSESYVFSEHPDSIRLLRTIPGFFHGESSFPHFLKANRISILTVLVKKDAVLKVGGFSERKEIQNAEDLHLWLKLLLAGYSFLGLKESLAHYRFRENSASSQDRHVIFESLHVLQDLTNFAPQYQSKIADAFFYRVNTFLWQNNIADWAIIDRLLRIIEVLTGKKRFIRGYRLLHKVWGKRVFRLMYKFLFSSINKTDIAYNIKAVKL